VVCFRKQLNVALKEQSSLIETLKLFNKQLYSMIDKSLLSEVFDSKVVNVIESLLAQETDFFSIRELADKADVTISTTFRIVQSLEKVGFVKKVQRGRIKFFQIQKPAKAYKQLSQLFDIKTDVNELIKAKVAEKYGEVELEIFSPKKDKNKIFLISEQELDDSELTKDITTQVGKKLNLLHITPEQFQKMKDMKLI
jgi:DNA-binding transcriptional regulator YhcF (GntR family)